MGACQIIIIILHLIIIPLNKNCLSFLIAMLWCVFWFFLSHLNVLLLLLIIILTATFIHGIHTYFVCMLYYYVLPL